MKRVIAVIAVLVLVGLLGAAGYLYHVRARQTALDQAVQKLNTSTSAQVTPAVLQKIEGLYGGGAKLTASEELAVAGAYARTGNDDKALAWYQRAASDGQNQGLPIRVQSREWLAHFYSVKANPDIQACGKQYEALRSSLIADGSPAAQGYLAEVDMLHGEDLITHVRGHFAQIGFQQSSAELTQANDLLWRALSRAKSAQMSKDDRNRLLGRIHSDQQLLSNLVQ